MVTEGEKRRRWQFSLRWLLAAMLVVGVGLGLFVRWWTTPVLFIESRHDNGTLLSQIWCRRASPGKWSDWTEIGWYSNGQKAFEGPLGGPARYWSPTGEPTNETQWEKFWGADKEDGTFWNVVP